MKTKVVSLKKNDNDIMIPICLFSSFIF